MSRPSFGERLAIARFSVGMRRRVMAGRWRTSPLLGWRLMPPRANDFLLIPSDMWPKDPSFLDEIAAGQLGLAGQVLDIADSSPFGMVPPGRRWARALHGFAWLGDLRAAGGDTALAIARGFVSDWVGRHRSSPGGAGVAGEPDIAARRIMSWIAGAGFLLEDADAAFYRQFMRALGLELRALDGRRPLANPGLPQLQCLMALHLASLAVAGQETCRPRLEAALLAELDRQILADGGHISRNADVLLDVLLDLLPIRQCYSARGLAVPSRLGEVIERMLGFLRAMTTASGRLGRFNGVGLDRSDVLATVLAFDGRESPPKVAPGPSGYVRLARGSATLIVDCGSAPPLPYAGTAGAGCLSFELSDAGAAVVVNRGAPAVGPRWVQNEARATECHSTLVLDGQNSGRFVRSANLERRLGGPAVLGPRRVVAAASEIEGRAVLEAWHDGYQARTGLLHERRLELAQDGRALDGVDRLRPLKGTLRLARDLPFAVHFHLAVDTATEQDGQGAILLRPPGAPAWRLSATNCRIGVATATDYAHILGPAPARQVVLRAACGGEATIRWRLERQQA